MQLAIEYKATTDARANGNVEHRIDVTSSAPFRFAKRCRVAIVGDYCRRDVLFAPRNQWEIFPAVDVMAKSSSARFRVHRPAEADGYLCDRFAVRYLLQCRFDLPENAFGSVRLVDSAFDNLPQLGRAVARGEL